MNMLKSLSSLLLVCLVAACGGGGGSAGTPVLGPNNTTASVNDLVLVLSAASITNTGQETVDATVTAVDSNRAAVANVPVTIGVDKGGVVVPSGPTTDANGRITATVGIGSDRTNRTLTVTVRSGSITRTATLAVTEGSATATASDLVLVISAPSIANNGSQTVTATATALDAKRNTLSGVAVALSVDSNATVNPEAQTTGANGTVRGIIGIGSDRTNRTIKVTATSGTITRTANLLVTDATGGTPVAADLSLALSAPTLPNSGTAAIVATATAVDANRNTIAGIPITFKVDNSATATASAATTNATGVVTANIQIGADRSNRLVTVTATSGTLTKTASFRVIGANLTASFTPLVNTGTQGNQVEFTLIDTNATPMVNQEVVVSAPGLPTSTGLTDINGKFTYLYNAPSAPAILTITGSAAGDTEVASVTVQTPGGGAIPPASEVPFSASVTANPGVVSVNTPGSNLNQAELRALFLGANNRPIQNIRARFDLAGNQNNTDGVPRWLGDFAYSDSNGLARATFTPGVRSSPTNGVTIRLCYDLVDFPPGACPRSATTTLTVASEALSVSLRTNELIKEGSARLTYIKEYVVLVVDAAGLAKPDVTITPSIDLTGYRKGVYRVVGDRWVQFPSLDPTENYQWDTGTRAWVKVGGTFGTCPNEDFNRNAVREAGAILAGAPIPPLQQREEDLNWNGDLDPRKADVAIKMVGSARTDSSGLAIVQIEYGKSLGSWVDFVITVTASGIAGTEARARFQGTLPVSSEAITNARVDPAFVISPYGTSAVCTDAK